MADRTAEKVWLSKRAIQDSQFHICRGLPCCRKARKGRERRAPAQHRHAGIGKTSSGSEGFWRARARRSTA